MLIYSTAHVHVYRISEDVSLLEICPHVACTSLCISLLVAGRRSLERGSFVENLRQGWKECWKWEAHVQFSLLMMNLVGRVSRSGSLEAVRATIYTGRGRSPRPV